MSELLVPVSIGELIDKITILKIKEKMIAAPDKVANVRAELSALVAICGQHNLDIQSALALELEEVNLKLWHIEDAIRDKEAASLFDADFISLARAVYRTNDQRAALKSKINAAMGSRYREEKSYRDYR